MLGAVDRDRTEACLQEVVPRAKLERDGTLTRVITSRRTEYLGWASDGTVYWNTDRAVVADAVAQKTTITDNADVMALVARIDHKKPMWFAMVGDFTSKLIGVPSTAVLFETDLIARGRKYTAKTRPRIPITIEFASHADVQRAIAALRAPHPSLSRAVVAQLSKLAPIDRDRDLELDIGALFAHPELYEEMQAALERIMKP